ncbi:MAG: zinc ribbon domain-containing protein [Clostridia bacterium]|nr:zinc ribbon domain-containing protein [Clostridia bacterium]
MAYCPYCGCVTEQGGHFCKNCGARIDDQSGAPDYQGQPVQYSTVPYDGPGPQTVTEKGADMVNRRPGKGVLIKAIIAAALLSGAGTMSSGFISLISDNGAIDYGAAILAGLVLLAAGIAATVLGFSVLRALRLMSFSSMSGANRAAFIIARIAVPLGIVYIVIGALTVVVFFLLAMLSPSTRNGGIRA